MLKRLFLSILIMSALASENGVYFSADLLDFYLANLSSFDIVQDGTGYTKVIENNATSAKSGTPAAFYKIISQKAFDAKSTIRHNYSEQYAITAYSAVLALIVVTFLVSNKKVLFRAVRQMLSLTDSSPPVLF